MKYAICNELFEGWPFERVCRFVSSVGYTGLEIAPFTLAPQAEAVSAERRQDLRRWAQAEGVEIVGLHWLLAKTEGLHLTSPDPETRRRTADYLVELARLCHDLGGGLMVLGSPKQRDLAAGMDVAQGEDFAAEVFERCLPIMESMGVSLCLEPLTPAETNFINTCADALRIIERVGRPNLRLHLDVKAMSSEPRPIAETIRQYLPHTGHFHANDANLRGPGFGPIDFVPIFRALQDGDYLGWISVEVFDFAPDPETIARESIRYMRACEERAATHQAGTAG